MLVNMIMVAILLGFIFTFKMPSPVQSFSIPQSNQKLKIKGVVGRTPTILNPPKNCPTDVEMLTAEMLRDLPSYANRIIQLSRHRGTTSDYTSLYIIIAGRPEFAPLSLGPGKYNPTDSAADLKPPQQVFFTTLERQYRDGKVAELENYHWLFLTYTKEGWQLAMIYSQFGSYPATTPPTAPQESSNGIIGQAIRIWLRDCRAGNIKPLAN